MSEDENIEMAGLSLAMPLKELRAGRNRLSVSYCDETAFQMYSHELTADRLPEKETEIAVSSIYLESQGTDPVPGQTIILDLGTDVPEEYTVCGLVRDEDANNAYEAFVSRPLLEDYFSGNEIPYSALIRMEGCEDMGLEELRQHAPYRGQCFDSHCLCRSYLQPVLHICYREGKRIREAAGYWHDPKADETPCA